MGIFVYITIGIAIKMPFLFINNTICSRMISRWTRTFSRFLRLLLNIRVTVEGDRLCLNEHGNFIVSNHLGYLDGVILGSLFAVAYTSKSQVRNWPLFGWMTEIAGTIFIDRQRKDKSIDYIDKTSWALERKINVLVFPEGTSTDGDRLLPFQSVHFQAPLNAKSPILPVTITYTKINQEEVAPRNRDRVCWYGQLKFYEHICKILELNSIEAKIIIHPKIDTANLLRDSSQSRKDLSEILHKIISHNYPLFR